MNKKHRTNSKVTTDSVQVSKYMNKQHKKHVCPVLHNTSN